MATPLSQPTLELLHQAKRALGEQQFNALLAIKGFRSEREIPNDSVAAEILAWLKPSLDLERRLST